MKTLCAREETVGSHVSASHVGQTRYERRIAWWDSEAPLRRRIRIDVAVPLIHQDFAWILAGCFPLDPLYFLS